MDPLDPKLGMLEGEVMAFFFDGLNIRLKKFGFLVLQ